MQFGKVSINPIVGEFNWKEFQDLYEHSLKGNVTETAEEIADKLGIKIPKASKKDSNV
jgi:hypothetical protein